MLSWLIYFSIPAILGGVGAFLRLLLKKPHPMIGKRNEITTLYDVNGNIFSVETLVGYVVVLQAWSEVHNLGGICRRLMRFSTTGNRNQATLKCFLVYVGEDSLNVIPKANKLLAKYPIPILLDKDGVFPRFFGKEFKIGGLILDDKGIVRSVPRDRVTGFDKKIIRDILLEKKSG